jgi:hypothetical protein
MDLGCAGHNLPGGVAESTVIGGFSAHIGLITAHIGLITAGSTDVRAACRR